MTTKEMTDAARSRAARQMMKQAAAQLAGKQRGPDPHVLRGSLDIDHPDAQPWRPLGDGSTGAGVAHVEALVKTAEEQRHQQWLEQPLQVMRAKRIERDQLAAELEALDAQPQLAPIGRRGEIRQRLDTLQPELDTFEGRLRRIDVTVLQALLSRIDFATGRLFPALATIAAKAGCHRNSVIEALARLKAHGFLRWVRRSIRTGAEGQFAPQREQTSNAYEIAPAKTLVGRARTRFFQLLTAKLKRLAPRRPLAPQTAPTRPVDPETAALLDRIEATILTREAALSAST